jgi:cytochrome c oxidase cbb3-type subunit III
MSEEKTFDGIISADNPMPGWYMIGFVGTVLFAVVYLLNYHVINEWSQHSQYDAEVAAHIKKHGTGELPSTGGNTLRGNAAAIAAGEGTFKGTCAACHGQDAKGLVGPNLTDAEWLHGKDGVMNEDLMFDVVSKGRLEPKQNPAKGPMPPHGHLGSKAIWEVIAYLENTYKNVQPSN